MVTGITLHEGPYDGIPMNIETPLPGVLVMNGYVYFQKYEDRPDWYEYITAVDVSDRLPTEEELKI